MTFLLLFYDLKYINSTKKWFSDKKSGIVPIITLISNLKINIVTKFQVFIFKNDEVKGGGGRNPQTWNKLDRRQRGIGLKEK